MREHVGNRQIRSTQLRGSLPGHRTRAKEAEQHSWVGHARHERREEQYTEPGQAASLVTPKQKLVELILNSKIRHVKCDEAKPICRRCSTQGYKCDGYNQFIQFAPNATDKVSGQRHYPQQRCKTTATQPDTGLQKSLLACVRSPIIQISSNSTENAFLHHVRTCVVQDIAAAGRPSDFWYDYVLPLSHSTAAIKHALCALGAAHRYFVSYHEDPSVKQSKTVFSLESMQCYNEAIAALNSLLSSETSANWDVVLICCVIFITIENLNGRSAEAACHLRAGCGILKRFGLNDTRATTDLMSRGNTDGLLFTLQDMLYYFGQYLAMFIGVDAFADLDFDVPLLSMGDPESPFTSLKEAEMMFQNIDRAFNIRMWKAKAYSPRPATVTDIFAERTESLESQGPAMDRTTRSAAKMAARSDLAIWHQRFQPLTRQKSQDPRHITALALDYAVWSIIVNAQRMTEDFGVAECDGALRLAEEMISMDAASAHPRFNFDGNLVWMLWYICFGTRDAGIQSKCIRLLRAANRREGVWDSYDVATICETAVAALKSNIICWKDVPHGILTLADMLHVRLQGFSLESVQDIAAEAGTRNGRT